MKILIIGGDGMIGHNLYKELNNFFEVKITIKKSWDFYKNKNFFKKSDCYFDTDILNLDILEKLIKSFNPNVVINAVGITKQRIYDNNLVNAIIINSNFPHSLTKICLKNNSKLILLSSDCVFSGKKGDYREIDEPDATDIYGITKILGEVLDDNVITLRKSTIGLELNNSHGLIEWFLAQNGNIKGYNKAIYSGLIVSELARFIKILINKHMDLSGTYNVSSEPISKYDLLSGLKERLKLNNLFIEPDDTFACDRSLNMENLKNITGYAPPKWNDMLDEFAQDILNKREI